MHYLLLYDTASDYLQRRGEFRDAHLAQAWAAHEAGDLMLGGAVGDPIDGAMLLFNCASPEPVERFAKTDPYVLNGIVTGWRIKPWHTVAGSLAATPVRPV